MTHNAELTALRREHAGCTKRMSDLQEVLKEKEEEVSGLMAEGTALSKTQHVKDVTIKQLKAELKSYETKVCIMTMLVGRGGS